jgi:hypothetical protein
MKIKSMLQDVFMLMGAGLFCYGIYTIYVPAAAIVGGFLIFVLAYPGKKGG